MAPLARSSLSAPPETTSSIGPAPRDRPTIPQATPQVSTSRRESKASTGFSEVRTSSAVHGLSKRELDARELAVRYLDAWSAPNRLTLQATPTFYGSTVVFHGRRMSLQALLNEKRHFVQRWPNRTYRYRPETMAVRCEPGPSVCTVQSIFDFDAADPSLGRRSRGTGSHELTVSFAGDRPVIASEDSRVLGRRSSRLR